MNAKRGQRAFHRLTLVVLVITLIAGCDGSSKQPSEPESAEAVMPTVQVVPSGGPPEKRIVSTETIPQNNCGGSTDVSNAVERSRSIVYTLEIGAGVSVSASGSAGVPGIGEVQVGTEVAARYGVTYGQEETLSRSLTVSAKEGTNMVHTIQQVEYWETGELMIEAAGQSFSDSYSFRKDFGVELVKSENIGCPTETPRASETITADTPLPPTSTPTVIASPIPTLEPSPTADVLPTAPPMESETFSINLGPYEIGDIATELGTDLIVCERGDRKCLTGFTDGGRLDIDNLNLVGSFKIEFEVDWTNADASFLLQSNTGDEILIRFPEGDITFGNTEKSWGSTGWKGGEAVNKCKLTISSGLAKFYINDEFFGTIIVNPSATYTHLAISGIDKEQYLFSLEAGKVPPRPMIDVGDIIKQAPDGATFVIDLTPYEVGDIATHLGSELLVRDREGRKYVTGFTDGGKLDITNLRLARNFEIIFEADWTDSDLSFVLSSDSGDEITIDFTDGDIIFGNTSKPWGSTGWKGDDYINECRITVNSGTAKFYINSEFFGTLVTNPSTIYTHIVISGVQRQDFLFVLRGRNY